MINATDITEYLQNKMDECERRASNWNERIANYSDILKKEPDREDVKIEQEKCIGKVNEFLTVADFCKELLEKYF